MTKFYQLIKIIMNKVLRKWYKEWIRIN